MLLSEKFEDTVKEIHSLSHHINESDEPTVRCAMRLRVKITFWRVVEL